MGFQSGSPLSSSAFSDLRFLNLYNAGQVRELDRVAIEDFGVPGIVLMKRAGQAIMGEILERFSDQKRALSHLLIFCGPGNNGGDGYIVAGLAKQKNIEVSLIETAGETVSGDAKRARDFALSQGVAAIDASQWLQNPEDSPANFSEAKGAAIVDALLGTGFSGELRAPYAALIASINQSGLPVFAADIPSGLCANTGAVTDQVVRAEVTVTFIGMKIGLLTGQGRNFSGDIVFDDLEVASEIYGTSQPVATLLDYDLLIEQFPERDEANHKGHHGHVVVVGGDQSFGGAPLMAASAAARVGTGLVSVVTREEHRTAILARQPELMVCNADDMSRVQALLKKADVIVVGPGLGTDVWGQKLLQSVLRVDKPVVADADALNIIASGKLQSCLPLTDSVITPHPREAGRLLGLDAEEINQNRVSAVETLQKRFAAVALLKGSGTLICDGGISLCPYGNPGMGTGGMGDVLSGIIGGLMAQGLPPNQSAKLGACLHAYAADLLAEERGQIGLMATDILDEVRRLINGI